MAKAPARGLHKGIDFDDYRQWNAVNQSSFRPMLRRSPRHYKYEVENETPETPALRLGTLCHKATLERKAFETNYAVIPDDELAEGCRTSSGKLADKPKNTTEFKLKKVDWLLKEGHVPTAARREFARLRDEINPDAQIEWLLDASKRSIVTQREYDEISGMLQALLDHDEARRKINRTTKELSMVWKTDGVLCKGRIDGYRRREFILDLKTTEDCTEFSWSMWRFAYHVQAAFYQDAIALLTDGELLPVYFIVVEKRPPHGVMVAPVHDDDIDQGRAEYTEALKRIKRCRRAKDWPSYESPEFFRLPRRHRRDEQRHELSFEDEVLTY